MTEMVCSSDTSLTRSEEDAITCAVPSCINRIPPQDRTCQLHQCGFGRAHCNCAPPRHAMFFPFPNELERRAKWIKLIKREDLIVGGQSNARKRHVCSCHFLDAKPTSVNPDPVLNLGIRPNTGKLVDSDGSASCSTDSMDTSVAEEDNEEQMTDGDTGPNLSEEEIKNDSIINVDPQEANMVNSPKNCSKTLPTTEGKFKDTNTTILSSQTNNGVSNPKPSQLPPRKTRGYKVVVDSPSKQSRRLKARKIKKKDVVTSSDDSDSNSNSGSGSESDDRVYCKCGAPNTDNMIGCDGKNCKHEWFHFKCVGINPKKVPRGKWFCESCQVTNSKVDREWKSKVEQVCREIVQKKLTIQSASQAYGISVELLSSQLNNKPILTTKEELRLVEMSVNMCRRGHWPMVKDSVLSSVKVLLDVEQTMGIKRLHPFKRNKPGDRWWESFCKRHPKMKELEREYKSKLASDHNSNLCSKDVKRKAAEKWGSSVQETISKLCKTKTPDSKKPPDKVPGVPRKPKLLKKEKKGQIPELSRPTNQTIDGEPPMLSEPNSLDCLEALIIKKRKRKFQECFKRGDENDNDVVYSAWRALKFLCKETEEMKHDGHSDPAECVPPTQRGIPPWSPCAKGPFYVADESSKTSVSLLIGEPGKKHEKRLVSRIASMQTKSTSIYLEPWRFRLSKNRKSQLKPWKFEVKRRNRRKSFVTHYFHASH